VRHSRQAPGKTRGLDVHTHAFLISEPIEQRLVVFPARLGLGDQLLRGKPLERGRVKAVGPDGAAQPEGVFPRELCATEECVVLDVPRALAQVAVPAGDVFLQQLAWLGVGVGVGVGVG
jgi:hypothetical protein